MSCIHNPEIIYAFLPWCCTAYAGTGRLPISIRHWGHVLCRSNQLNIHAAQNVWPSVSLLVTSLPSYNTYQHCLPHSSM